MRRGWVILALATFATACGPAATPAPTPAPTVVATLAQVTLSGTFTIHDDFLAATFDGDCAGGPNYSDIHDGTTVTVTDGGGNIVGLGALKTTKAKGGQGGLCTWSYAVSVPIVPFYQITIAQHGGLKYSLADMQATGWIVAASLGP